MALGEFGQQLADDFLPLFAGGDIDQARSLVFLGTAGEVLERGFGLQPGDAFRCGLEIEAQGALDGDLVVTEVFVVEDLADDQLLPALAFRWITRRGRRGYRDHLAVTIKQHPAAGAALEFAVQSGDVCDVIRAFWLVVGGIANAAAFVAKAFFHLHPVIACVDELHPAFPVDFLVVGEHPEVGGNAGVVEQLLGQGDHGFQPVVLDDPAADFRFAAAGIAGEQG